MDSIDIKWLDPIRLKVSKGEAANVLIKRLNRQIADETSEAELKRSVYVIRMAGSFVMQYPDGASPVVYIGRGDSVSRLATHLKNWASDIFVWGSDSEIEIRILRPARKNRTTYFKSVEADLIRSFWARYGSLPLINSRFETAWEGLVDYGATQEKDLRQMLGIGKGVRHKWAITPMPSNQLYRKYLKGM